MRPAPAAPPAPRLSARRAAAVAVCGCLLGLVAFIFDAAPLFVPAVGMALMGVLAPAWVWLAARGAVAERRLAAERVVEREPLEGRIAVRRGWLGLGGWGSFRVTDPLTGASVELRDQLSLLRGGRAAALRVVARFERRGLHRLAPPVLTVADPLELAHAQTAPAGSGEELLVLPATEPVRWLRADRARGLHLPDGRAGSEALAAVDLDGLRPYRPGTPASRIHWPALARGAGLIERRLQADGDSRPLVVLDSRLPAASGAGALLDAAVRAAASLVLELARGGGCGLLLPGELRATVVDRDLIAWPAAYARLAVVEGAVTGTSGDRARGPALAGVRGRSGAIIYVAASPVQRLGALLATAGGPAVLVVPDDVLVAGRPPGVRGPIQPALSVSGCQGYLLGAGRSLDRPAGQRTVA